MGYSSSSTTTTLLLIKRVSRVSRIVIEKMRKVIHTTHSLVLNDGDVSLSSGFQYKARLSNFTIYNKNKLYITISLLINQNNNQQWVYCHFKNM